ncbi:MAG: methyltransferase domain-containing protein [Pseudomonadota bacterium]
MGAFARDYPNNVPKHAPNDMMLHDTTPDLQRRLDRAATNYDAAAFLQQRAATEMLDRLDLTKLDPALIVDLGATTGFATRALSERYPSARVVGVDSNAALLRAGGLLPSRWALRAPKVLPLVASGTALPFRDNSVDLVFSNLWLPRFGEPDTVFGEISRVLKTGGSFVFSSLGPATLAELRSAWQTCDDAPHVSAFLDMHDVGDALGRAGFAEPVLDVEMLTVSYETTTSLWQDLSGIGARNTLPDRHRALTGKQRFAAMRQALEGTDGSFKISVELVFGQCWGGRRRESASQVTISPASIGFRKR